MVDEEFPGGGGERVGCPLRGSGTRQYLARAVVRDHVNAAGAGAVYLVGQLARLPQRQRAAEHGGVGRLPVRQIHRAKRQLGGAAIRPAEAHRPSLGTGGPGLDDEVQGGRLGVAYLAAVRGVSGVFANRRRG